MNLYVRWALAAAAVAGTGLARWHFPEENNYSIMTHTISFLGSPDHDRNPPGWRYYQIGMTAALALLIGLTLERGRKFRAKLGRLALWTSGVVVLSMLMMLATVWLPDARQLHWRAVQIGDFHNAIIIPAILLMMVAIVTEGIAVRMAKFRGGVLWAYRVFGMLFVTGLAAIFWWKVKCARDRSLPTWPGEGIHSIPLWEWLLFAYLIGFSFYLAGAGDGDSRMGRRGGRLPRRGDDGEEPTG